MNLDCGDSLCLFAEDKKGQRTNGGCRCFSKTDYKHMKALKRKFQGLMYDNEKYKKFIESIREYVSGFVFPDGEGYQNYLKTMRIEKLNPGADIVMRSLANNILWEMKQLEESDDV